MRRSVTLFDEHRQDGSSLHLSAVLKPDGKLLIEGHDMGPVTAPISPDGEYEYFYAIRAMDVPTLVVALGGTPDGDILALLEERWVGENSYGLEKAIRECGVAFTFFAYP